MSGIAEVLLSLGIEVQGSDLSSNESSRRLQDLGAKVFQGHRAEQIEGADIIVISSAIRSDNPEFVEAERREIPVIPRARMLAELMRLQQGIAIAGSHGKTTTTSLVAAILEEAALDPTVVIGGKVNHLGSNAKHGKGRFMVAEADESDGSFLMLLPNIAVVTNIDSDHLDFWKGGLQEIKNAFEKFLNGLPFFGLAVACVDALSVREVLQSVKRRVVTYGLVHLADYQAKEIQHERHATQYRLFRYGEDLGLIRLNLLGDHNVQNSLAAIAVGDELGVDLESMKRTLQRFSGVQRRFTQVGEKNGILVIDDYGHHPIEISMVLKAARQTFPGRRVGVLFEPHRYTRTRDHLNEFADALMNTDYVVISDIYPASEPPIAGVDSSCLVTLIQERQHPEAYWGGSLQDATSQLIHLARSGDVLITLGAGSIAQCAPRILERL